MSIIQKLNHYLLIKYLHYLNLWEAKKHFFTHCSVITLLLYTVVYKHVFSIQSNKRALFQMEFFFLLSVFQFLCFFPCQAKMGELPNLNSGPFSYFLLLYIFLYVAFLLASTMLSWYWIYWLQLRILFSCNVDFLPLGECAAPEIHCSEACPHHHIIGYKHNHSHILVCKYVQCLSYLSAWQNYVYGFSL